MKGLEELVEELRRIEKARVECANKMRGMDGIKRSCSKKELNLKVGAVDASIVAQEFHAFDLIIAKTVGAVFEYKNGKLVDYEYVPSPFPKEKVSTHGSMDLVELNQYRNIVRLKEEIRLAKSLAEKCDLMLIDGSLVPLPNDKPSNKALRKEYDALVKEYAALYEKNESNIAGIVKDCRSRRFIEETIGKENQNIASSSTDSTLLDLVLDKGEITRPVSYAKDAKINSILKDLMPYSERLNAVYMKAGKNDRPVRIEFFKKGEKWIETIHSLCAINDNYSYPAILIDVDLRALIDPKNVERIYREIELMPFLRDSKLLRRNSRPFR